MAVFLRRNDNAVIQEDFLSSFLMRIGMLGLCFVKRYENVIILLVCETLYVDDWKLIEKVKL